MQVRFSRPLGRQSGLRGGALLTPPGPFSAVEGHQAVAVERVGELLKSGELKDIVKLNIYMTDLANFATVNEIMATYFQEPYPARAAVGVAALPKGVPVEMEAVMVLS